MLGKRDFKLNAYDSILKKLSCNAVKKVLIRLLAFFEVKDLFTLHSNVRS